MALNENSTTDVSHLSHKRNSNVQIMAPGDRIGAGDSRLVADILPLDVQEDIFEKLIREVEWATMYHRGGEVPRQVAVQGEVNADGSFPIYRHPADESPPLRAFTPTVQLIRNHVQNVLNHPVNHVLIQHYRSGNDYISEHSDKTIDIVRGTNIVNVSFGATRTMTLHAKKDRSTPCTGSAGQIASSSSSISSGNTERAPPRDTQRIPLPHNSMFVMGLVTNCTWLHGINRDNRPRKAKAESENAYNGARISLTFRHIGTFLNKDETMIWGQGATRKTQEEAQAVINGGPQAQALLDQFGIENHHRNFNWARAYGKGFDVLHFNPL